MILCNAPRFGAVGVHCALRKGHQGEHQTMVSWNEADNAPPDVMLQKPEGWAGIEEDDLQEPPRRRGKKSSVL